MDYNDLTAFLTVRKGLSEKTIKYTLAHTKTLEKWLESNNKTFKPLDIEAYLFGLKNRGVKASTINSRITYMVYLQDYFKDRGLSFDLGNFHRLPEERPHIIILSVAEIKKILSVDVPYPENHNGKDTSQLNHIYKAYWHTLAMTGIRRGEGLSLICKYVTLDYITVHESKNYEFRRIPITSKLYDLLLPLIHNKAPDDLVFTTSNNKPIDDKSLRRDLDRRRLLAHIPRPINPHLFRHSFATELLSNGVDISIVASLLGHAKTDTTFQNYAHLADTTLRKGLIRHPLLRESVPPSEILNNLVEMIRGLKLEHDDRFAFRLNEGNNSLDLQLFLK